MRNLSNRVAKLEQSSTGDYVEVMPIEWFYGDRDAKPIRMTRQEFQGRTLDDFYREEGQS
ncbi:hypothetical protein [Ralstonia pickettii]|uniref:hypothetical protein n=1 Tax=Ralstonia pickettii TaxID=329 RepID=UPI000818A08E|nr:hypothetical protein [Ralstonia pickettii]OCS50804.1 hypothetical protein BEK68_09705 [Ralstonia pickettii]